MSPVLTLSLNNLGEFDFVARTLRAASMPTPLPLIEILWDNYCCTDPAELAEDLSGLADQVSLHIMWSRFLEREEAEFEAILKRLDGFVKALKPVAISDHLCRFSVSGVRVPFAQEHDYQKLDETCARVARYQECIKQPLLLENAASTHHPAERQIAFVDRVQARTGCGILFDVSNAVAGELNGLGSVDTWLSYLRGRTLRCHVGSYGTHPESGTVQDTHAHDLSLETEHAIQKAASLMNMVSLTYERDYRYTVETCSAELGRIRTCTNA